MLAIAGCSEDNTHPKVSPVDEPSADAVTILATLDAIPSATGDGEAYAPLWQEGDQIVVGYKGISYVYETYDAGNGVEFHPMALSLPADARGEVTAYFKAVDGVFAVGADQTGATLPMYAYAADASHCVRPHRLRMKFAWIVLQVESLRFLLYRCCLKAE